MDARLDRIERDVQKLEAGHDRLELMVTNVVTDHAVLIATAKSTDRRLGHIEESLSRLVWLIILGLLGALMQWIVGGGLSSVA